MISNPHAVWSTNRMYISRYSDNVVITVDQRLKQNSILML